MLLFTFLLIARLFFSPVLVDIAYAATQISKETFTVKTRDWIAPITTLLKKQAGKFTPLHEQVVNGTFEDGFAGWQQKSGESSSALNLLTLGSAFTTYSEPSCVSQLLPIGVEQITIRFRVFSYETLPGFDDPAFLVEANSIPVFSVKQSELPQHDGLRESEWKRITISLKQFAGSPTTLSLLSGNTGDNTNPTWVEISEITSLPQHTNINDRYALNRIDNNSSQSFAQLGQLTTLVDHLIHFAYPFSPQPLLFWSTDAAQNKEEAQTIEFSYDLQPPQVPLSFQQEKLREDQYLLTFEKPLDNLNTPLTFYVYLNENSVSLTPNHVERAEHSPLRADTERLYIHLDQPLEHPSFSIVVEDAHGNRSLPIKEADAEYH